MQASEAVIIIAERIIEMVGKIIRATLMKETRTRKLVAILLFLAGLQQAGSFILTGSLLSAFGIVAFGVPGLLFGFDI